MTISLLTYAVPNDLKCYMPKMFHNVYDSIGYYNRIARMKIFKDLD